MSQPNFQRVTDPFKGITEECEKISNIPAVGAGHNLAAIMTEMRDEMRGLAQQMNDNTINMRNDIAALRIDVNTMRTNVNTLRRNLVTLQHNVTSHLNAK